MALIDVAVYSQESNCKHLELLLLSCIENLLPLIGYELDFEVTAKPLDLYLPFIVVKTSSIDICNKFSHLQSTFKNFEDATTSLVFSIDEDYFVSEQSLRLQNFIGILDEIERVLKENGLNVKSLDEVLFEDSMMALDVSYGNLAQTPITDLLMSTFFDSNPTIQPSMPSVFSQSKLPMPQSAVADNLLLMPLRATADAELENGTIIAPTIAFCDPVSHSKYIHQTNAFCASATSSLASAPPIFTTNVLSASVCGHQCCALHTAWSLLLLWLMLYQFLLMPLV